MKKEIHSIQQRNNYTEAEDVKVESLPLINKQPPMLKSQSKKVLNPRVTKHTDIYSNSKWLDMNSQLESKRDLIYKQKSEIELLKEKLNEREAVLQNLTSQLRSEAEYNDEI